MWKDFFYYSKSERRAVYVLLVLITLLVIGIVSVPERSVPLAVNQLQVDCRYRCPSKTNGMAPSGTSAMLFNENKAKKKQTKQNIFFITESIFQHLSLNGPI